MSAIRKRSRKTWPFAVQAQHAAYRAARAVGDDQPVAVHAVLPVGRLDAHAYAVRLLFDADHLVLPAQLRLRQFREALDQELLRPSTAAD